MTKRFFPVPPDPLVIFDETGSRRTTFVGPYRETDDVTLVCDAFGGDPSKHLDTHFPFVSAGSKKSGAFTRTHFFTTTTDINSTLSLHKIRHQLP
jgi:hypothetical protein